MPCGLGDRTSGFPGRPCSMRAGPPEAGGQGTCEGVGLNTLTSLSQEPKLLAFLAPAELARQALPELKP